MLIIYITHSKSSKRRACWVEKMEQTWSAWKLNCPETTTFYWHKNQSKSKLMIMCPIISKTKEARLRNWSSDLFCGSATFKNSISIMVSSSSSSSLFNSPTLLLVICTVLLTSPSNALKYPFHPRDVLPLLPRQVSWPILNSLNGAADLLPAFVGSASAQNDTVEWKGACFYKNQAWMEFHNKSGSEFGGGTLHIKVLFLFLLISFSYNCFYAYLRSFACLGFFKFLFSFFLIYCLTWAVLPFILFWEWNFEFSGSFLGNLTCVCIWFYLKEISLCSYLIILMNLGEWDLVQLNFWVNFYFLFLI